MVGMLPLDLMAGPTLDEFDGSEATGNTILSGINLIDTVVLNSSDIGKSKGGSKAEPNTRQKQKKPSSLKRDSCNVDEEAEEMIGGNFNTFGEQVPTAALK